ncbi:hypothetical protein JQN72_00420 [Phycicoccus sp. CSK15P-2]|uniref:hypothetical protein n=1 Tax=Phycicoccus sp. CSK15P-2 TaxID=2807627 RepID=UPI00194FE033|nr:hypothetical protein [Phycicoccus sp. CSK15P-2]MBM6402708.1 hypothetical protein [Phycicoccus sp. CSK15P-2]
MADDPDVGTDVISVLGRLYPEPQPVPRGSRGGDLLALPSLAEARVVLPAAAPLASSALRHSRRTVGRTDRVRTTGMSFGLRLGAGRLVGSRVALTGAGQGIDGALAEVFGHPVVTGMFLGPPRANRKPVLQVLDAAGRVVGFAKVGITPLAAALAAREAETLRILGSADLGVVDPPRLLAELEWDGLPVVVQSALPVWEQGPGLDHELFREAIRDIADTGPRWNGQWRDCAYRGTLRERVAAVEDPELRALAAGVLDSRVPDDLELSTGAWHGDLSAFNAATTAARRVLVWDWERYEQGVPVGFDALHHVFLPMLRERSPRVEPAVALLHRAPSLLGPLGVGPSAAAGVATLYLAELAARFSRDQQGRTGTAGGDPRHWMRPLAATAPSSRSADG